MNGDAEKCDAYDKIDSANNNLNLLYILIHIKLRFIDVNISQLVVKKKGTSPFSIALLTILYSSTPGISASPV